MSRPASLPPRCPFPKRVICRSLREPITLTPLGDYEHPPHHQSSYQSSILDGQPPWLDDLFNEQNLVSRGINHRRSVSDSATLLDGIDKFAGASLLRDDEEAEHKGISSYLELASTYGPNSPRKKANFTFSEREIVSALSECVSENPMHNLNHLNSDIGFSNLKLDNCSSRSEFKMETRTVKRDHKHPGQRLRVRQIQYIAELERTVNALQTLETELAATVASIFQQHVALSMENSNLKQQIAKVQEEKLLVHGRYQSLQEEFEGLKNGMASSPKSESKMCLLSATATETDRSDVSWQMLDITKLNLR